MRTLTETCPAAIAFANSAAPLAILLSGVATLVGTSPILAGISALMGFVFYGLRVARRETLPWLLIATACILSANANYDTFWRVLSLGGTYGSLMIAISFVQVPARHSILSETIASRLPSGKAMSATWRPQLAAHAAGATLNLSGLIILQTAVQRSAINANDKISTSSQFLRGFATAPVWSPYSYFTPLALTGLPSINWQDLIAMGACIALLFLIISLFNPPAVRTDPTPMSVDKSHEQMDCSSRNAMTRWFIFAAFFGTVIYLTASAKIGSLKIVILALPPLAVMWGLLEALVQSRLLGFAKEVVLHTTHKIPELRTEVLALAGAGMASFTLSSYDFGATVLSPAAALSVSAEVMQSILVFLPLVAFTAAGINPVLFIAPLGTILSDPASAPFSLSTGLAIICCTWALFPTISSFSAATLITSRSTGTPAWKLVSQVNGAYNARACIGSAALIAVSVVIERMFGS